MRDRSPPAKLIGAYLALALLGGAVPIAMGRDPLQFPDPLLRLERPLAVALSLGLGLLVAASTIVFSRVLVARSPAARALAGALAEPIEGSSNRTLVVLALAISVAEEILFRALLVPALGIVASSALFGLLHQVPGRGRWVWAGWATGMGLVFATLFLATGELVGPLVAHAVINAQNLRYLRDGRHRTEGEEDARDPARGRVHAPPERAAPSVAVTLLRARRLRAPLGGLLARAPRSRMG